MYNEIHNNNSVEPELELDMPELSLEFEPSFSGPLPSPMINLSNNDLLYDVNNYDLDEMSEMSEVKISYLE